MPRFFTENIDQNSGSITGEDAKHIARVLRMKNGQPLTVCDTKGYDYACIIEGITEEQIDLKVLSRSPSVTEPNVSVHLYQAMPKADKLELIIQKAVELGAYRVVPVSMKRSVVKLDAKKADAKRKRWNAVSESAAKQSKRSLIPEVPPCRCCCTCVPLRTATLPPPGPSVPCCWCWCWSSIWQHGWPKQN